MLLDPHTQCSLALQQSLYSFSASTCRFWWKQKEKQENKYWKSYNDLPENDSYALRSDKIIIFDRYHENKSSFLRS